MGVAAGPSVTDHVVGDYSNNRQRQDTREHQIDTPPGRFGELPISLQTLILAGWRGECRWPVCGPARDCLIDSLPRTGVSPSLMRSQPRL